jgi:hypothetical protein
VHRAAFYYYYYYYLVGPLLFTCLLLYMLHTHTCYLATIYLFVLPGTYTTKVSALVDEMNRGSDDPSGTGSVDHGGGEHFVFEDLFQFGCHDS